MTQVGEPVEDPLTVGEIIRKRREELGLSQSDLAKAVGVTDAYISAVERDVRGISRWPWQRLEALRKALRWTPEEFVEATGIELPGAEYIKGDLWLKQAGARPVTMTKVPLLGVVSAGRGMSDPTPIGEIEIPSEVVERYGRYALYALEVDGDSMYCDDLPYSIPPGSIVVVARELEPHPGDLVIAYSKAHDVGYLKELEDRRGHQILKSWNPEVPPIVVRPEDEVEVQGVVVHVGFDPRKVKR